MCARAHVCVRVYVWKTRERHFVQPIFFVLMDILYIISKFHIRPFLHFVRTLSALKENVLTLIIYIFTVYNSCTNIL